MLRKVNYLVWYVSLIVISITLMSSSSYASTSTYYVDIKGGSDSNNGTSQSTAWKSLEKANSMTFNPGDKLLFKAGGVWNGQLHPKGSGSDGSPIIIDMYGTGNKPVIAGGAATYAKNRAIGTVYLINQSYWEINNLEITAKDPANTKLDWRQGIVVTAAGIRVNHVYVNNCYIHDIFGNVDKQGGICFNSEAPDSITPTGFKDIRAIGNTIFNVSNAGITEMYNRVGQRSRGEIPGSAIFNQNNNSGFIVRGNVIHSIYRNCIIVRNDENALIERNVVYDGNYFNGKYTVSGNMVWGIYCQGTTYQYNEGYLKHGGDNIDPAFLHMDFQCQDQVFQYNYSHNNYGGLYDGGYYDCTSTTIIRYNISQNDLGQDGIVRITSWSEPKVQHTSGNFLIYNNVFYMNANFKGKVIKDFYDKNGAYSNVFKNNIFYFESSSGSNKGWCAEMRIPFSQLRFGKKEEQVWGLQFMRTLYREEERSKWQFIPKGSPGIVHLFGELHGIKNITPKRHVELLFYVVGRMERFNKEAGNPFMDGKSSYFSAGLDGKVGLTNDLTLDFTINPYFGQVEADPSEVNLTDFETYFPEPRPFFIKGKNIYQFEPNKTIVPNKMSSDNLFYFRRIGRYPHNYPVVADTEYVDIPESSTIIGAFGLTPVDALMIGGVYQGKAIDRHVFSFKAGPIGILESITADEKAVIDYSGNRRKETVEPLTNYFVARQQRDFNKGKTVLGGMVTAVNRDINNPALNYLPVAAYTGGIDFQHNWKERSWYVAGNAEFSTINGKEDAIIFAQRSSARYYQRPDANHLSVDSALTALAGYVGTIKLGKNSEKKVCRDSITRNHFNITK